MGKGQGNDSDKPSVASEKPYVWKDEDIGWCCSLVQYEARDSRVIGVRDLAEGVTWAEAMKAALKGTTR